MSEVAKDPRVKAIEEEADRLSRVDGKTSHKERYAIRAQLRAEAGLPKEQKKRGGIAGAYDRNKNVLLPLAAAGLGLATGGLAAPIAGLALARGVDREGQGGLGFDVGNAARGAMEGAAAGGLGQMAGGLLPTPAAGGAIATTGAVAAQSLPMGGVGGMPAIPAIPAATAAAPASAFSLGGVAGKAKDWLTANGGRNALGLATGVSGVLQQQRGNELMAQAARDESRRWAENAPLRDAGRSAMLTGVPGNPFARGGR